MTYAKAREARACLRNYCKQERKKLSKQYIDECSERINRRLEEFLKTHFVTTLPHLCLYEARVGEAVLRCSYYKKCYLPKETDFAKKTMVFHRTDFDRTFAGVGLRALFFFLSTLKKHRKIYHNAFFGCWDSLAAELQKDEFACAVMLVPCVAICAKTGFRIGSGHGYFDRYFQKLQKLGVLSKVCKVGVAWDRHVFSPADVHPMGISLTDALKSQAWDISMDRIITENRLLEIS